ncbi:MAG: LPS assembly protein LptD [Pseudomonadota bacterium]
MRRGIGKSLLGWACVTALAICLAVAWPSRATAQTASLVADAISLDGDSAIVAEGNVEIFFEGTTLRAARLRYDRSSDQLILDGPIRLSQGDETVLLANSGALDDDLRNGILRSARFVLDNQLQLSAARVRRIDGRYTELSRTIATACRICDENSPPIWEIRASRVVHDQQEKQLYLDNAQFRVGGVPIFYWPSLRLPDPTLTRASGFLLTRASTSSQLGVGLRFPYFIRLGDHADVTLTPYISTRTTTLEMAYRQEIRRGDLSFRGAVSSDSLRAGERSYLFGRGRLALSRGYELNFDIELVSDEAYLSDYDYSGKDRLDSAVALTRTERNEKILFEATDFRTLRASEIPISDTLPETLFEASYERQVSGNVLGGALWVSADFMALTRPSAVDGDGRDVVRTGAAIEWNASEVFGPGLIAEVEASTAVDVYAVNQDPTFGTGTVRATPAVAATLRWPLSRATPDGAIQSLEPVVQLAWSQSSGADVPDEDSISPELDEGNLFSLSRYPGSDRREEGFRGAAGVTWTQTYSDGGELALSFGRIFRFDDKAVLADDVADWLAAIRMSGLGGFDAQGRLLAEDDVGLTRAIGTIGWSNERTRLSGSIIRSFADPDAPTDDDTAELAFDGSYDFNRHWRGDLRWRYDLVADEPTSAGLGLTYRNECVGVDFDITQDYTDSSSIDPITTASLSVSLGGIGGGATGPARQCRG